MNKRDYNGNVCIGMDGQWFENSLCLFATKNTWQDDYHYGLKHSRMKEKVVTLGPTL